MRTKVPYDRRAELQQLLTSRKRKDGDPVAHQPVVVGYDGSQRSKDALVWAAEYARLSGAPLELVTAWETPPTFGGQVRFDDVDFEQEAKDRLSATVSELALHDVAVSCSVVRGHPAKVLVQVSRGASLLVLGARGRGGFAELVLGSVSQYCSHHAECPVVIMRNHLAASSGSPVAEHGS